MKATIECDLNEESYEFNAMINATKYKCALGDIYNAIRNLNKYTDGTLEDHQKCIELISEALNDSRFNDDE